ncbi:MAG TPA: phage portal protein [Noviherbaspirillum sp.]|nr:phage portal protein [Noviherbaspirillum sp.]
MSFLNRLLGGGIESPSASVSGTADPASWLIDLFGGMVTATGLRVGVREAMTVPSIASCVQVLSEDIAKVPLILYKRKRGGGRERAVNHPLYRILKERPAPWMSSFMWRRLTVSTACQHGNAFARVHRDFAGRVARIQPLPHGSTVMRWAGDGEPFFDISLNGQRETGLSYRDVIHLPYRASNDGTSNGGIFGHSPIAMHREAIALAVATERFGAKYFANGARPSAIIELDGKLPNDEVAARIRASIERTYSGVDNAGRVAILELGMKLKEVSSKNDQSQYSEVREFQAEEMARIYRVPPHKIGLLRRSTNNNIEHQAIEYVTDAVSPIAAAFEQQLTIPLLSELEQEDYFIEFELDGLLRGDIQSRYRAYSLGRQWGWLNVDEIREMENRNALPDGAGQEFLKPLNMAKAGSDPAQNNQENQNA